MDSSKALYVQGLQYLQNIQVINHKYKICELKLCILNKFFDTDQHTMGRA